LKNEKEDVSPKNQEKKPKKKKKGKIAEVFRLHQKGVSVKDIAEKMKLKKSVVRAYIWRTKNPEKYKELVKRWYDKKKAKEAKEQ
jgi:DNA-binding NarL/FixJ family response regulator